MIRRPTPITLATGTAGIAMVAWPGALAPRSAWPLVVLAAIGIAFSTLTRYSWPGAAAPGVGIVLIVIADPGPLVALGEGLLILLYAVLAATAEVSPTNVRAALRQHQPVLGAVPAGLAVVAGMALPPPSSPWLVIAGLVAAPAALHLAVLKGRNAEE